MTGADTLPWRASGSGLRLAVRVTPKASRDGVDGVETLSDGRPVLRLRVRALPDKGAANVATVKLLAKRLGLARSAVTLESGATARLKILHLDADPQECAARLMELCGGE